MSLLVFLESSNVPPDDEHDALSTLNPCYDESGLKMGLFNHSESNKCSSY